ncbi:MAG: tRNA uridine-5-carboxymethylaminomethyl(34) synthesis GTPase MnmE [Treponema sp.]|nr:tRNA uridine-5-carboxymethylaminomethyl(34) synthesis GTPase MnmE [Treponema sp.]
MTSTKINYGDESPIAAFATTPGNSALTLIRCSGSGAIDMVSSVFTSGQKSASLKDERQKDERQKDKRLKSAPGNTIIHGWITAQDTKIDEVLISVFRAPKSYTGEDSIDICCHGGISAGKAVMAVLKTAGFRDALNGEFTFRAFLNGKMDLTRSESVMELVSARSDKGRSNAVFRLCGALEKEINSIKTQLVQVLAGAEIYLDYSEDEISAEPDDDLINEIEGKLPNKDIVLKVIKQLKDLSVTWQAERIYQEGVLIVIAGCPNAGKSSLFNLLLKEDRSIITDTPGTTRDWIEAFVSIKGIPVRLIDTAGLRETSDAVEKIGVERSKALLQEADIVLYLIDGELGLTKADEDFLKEHSNAIAVWNKSDIAPPSPSKLTQCPQPVIQVSAKTGGGLLELIAAIVSDVQKNVPETSGSAALGTLRQKNLVDASLFALEEAIALSQDSQPLDLIAPLLRDAVNSLGCITGEVSTADILEEMFSRFCVGK